MVSQFSKAFLGNQFSAIYFSLRLHPVGSDTDELSGIEKIHEKSIVVLERVKIGFYLLFSRHLVTDYNVSRPGHDPPTRGYGPPFWPVRTVPAGSGYRSLYISGDREPTSGLRGWNGAVRSKQMGQHRSDVFLANRPREVLRFLCL